MTNVVPSSMTLALHLFRDKEILSDIRRCSQGSIDRKGHIRFDLKKLEKQPLLLSMYAETLRFGVQIHVPRSSPLRDIDIGHTLIPGNKLILMNTWLAHTDEAVWNTKGGAHPLHKFWAQRFLIDARDPASGPCKESPDNATKPETDPNKAAERLRYSNEGLEGAWIPFGGEVSLFS